MGCRDKDLMKLLMIGMKRKDGCFIGGEEKKIDCNGYKEGPKKGRMMDLLEG